MDPRAARHGDCALSPAGAGARAGRRGFTLVEMMVALAILGILVALGAYALGDATRRTRLSGAKFTLVSTLSLARQRALARGTDVYVIFSNLDSTQAWPESQTARVLVYEDNALALRGSANLMAVVDANPAGIRERFTAAGDSFGSSGFAFVDTTVNQVPACVELATLPPYIPVTAQRRTQRNCARAWCTFCEIQAAQCIGAIRFNSDGQARIVTGPTTGIGGLVKLVTPTDRNRSACIAIGEPSGVAVAL